MNLTSFIDYAPDHDFSIQNLPYGAFTPHAGGAKRIGVAIGDFVLDLAALENAGLLPLPEANVFAQPSLNRFMGLGKSVWQATRQRLQALLSVDEAALRDNSTLRHSAFFPLDAVTLHLPVEIGDYTDFYASKAHATNVGSMFRGKDQALPPNWLHMPIGYHGRASSVVVSGTSIRRPLGQIRPDGAEHPAFMPSQRMDFELEVGAVIGTGNPLGQPIHVDEAMAHVFGLVLVNDWSARDIQRWEYQPLGPFLSKNLATSISPWVVTLDALAPFRCPLPAQDPAPLPYLQAAEHFSFDLHLEAALQTPDTAAEQCISRTNFNEMYWSIAQQIAHHTITGCNLRTGDLLASGTISGTSVDSFGSLLELTWNGTQPLHLRDGATRAFLEDGDTVTLRGWCQAESYRVGFGEVRGTLLPAVAR